MISEKGVQRIPGVFSRAEVEKMRGQAYRALYQAKKDRLNYLQERADPNDPSLCWPSLLFWPSKTNAYLDQIRRDGRLVEIVQQHLGPHVRQVNNQLYYRFQGDGDSFGWHRDIRFRKHIRSADDYLQTIIVIDEITANGGAVEFVEGSHKGGEFEDLYPPGTVNLRKFERMGINGTKYTAKPGDVMIWRLDVLHGSEPNESDAPRLTYMNGFCKADALDDGWPLYP